MHIYSISDLFAHHKITELKALFFCRQLKDVYKVTTNVDSIQIENKQAQLQNREAG